MRTIRAAKNVVLLILTIVVKSMDSIVKVQVVSPWANLFRLSVTRLSHLENGGILVHD